MPRTIRELIIQLNTASSRMSHRMVPDCLVRGVTIAIRMKLGTTSSRSTIHINVRSRQPPKYPATAPTVAAMIVDRNATQTPISSDFCIPRNVCANRSWPSALVPNQCAVVGGSCRA